MVFYSPDDEPIFNALVKEVANEYISKMSDIEKENICSESDINLQQCLLHNWGYGLYIRNTYWERFEKAGIPSMLRDSMSIAVLRK